jgi:hypothetical protein
LIFAGSPESANVPSVCIHTQAQKPLTAQQLGALMYMRSRKANLAEPGPEEFGQFEGVDGADHAALPLSKPPGWWTTEDAKLAPPDTSAREATRNLRTAENTNSGHARLCRA